MSANQFEWTDDKDVENQAKHHVSFQEAQFAFADPHRVITTDLAHSAVEERFFYMGKIGGGHHDRVHFTY